MVELMVSLTLSLILIGGVLSLVYSSKVTYMENERVAGTQEGGRAAFEMIMRDLRGSIPRLRSADRQARLFQQSAEQSDVRSVGAQSTAAGL